LRGLAFRRERSSARVFFAPPLSAMKDLRALYALRKEAADGALKLEARRVHRQREIPRGGYEAALV